MNSLKGTGVALVTPFTSEGNIDLEGLKRVIDFTGKHVDYFVVLGTTGETATLTPKEKNKVLDFVKRENKNKLPIVVGIGGNNTAQVIAEIQSTDLDGVVAVLSVSPYYNKPSQEGLIAHYTAIANASPLPIILYNVPGRTGSNIAAATTLSLAKHPNIVGIKEACGDLAQTGQIASASPDNFMVISGDDMLTAAMMEQGAVGAISVLANGLPEEFSTITRHGLSGDFKKAHKASTQLEAINPLMYEESNPVGIKEVLRQKGICGNNVRLPLIPASHFLSARISELIK